MGCFLFMHSHRMRLLSTMCACLVFYHSLSVCLAYFATNECGKTLGVPFHVRAKQCKHLCITTASGTHLVLLERSQPIQLSKKSILVLTFWITVAQIELSSENGAITAGKFISWNKLIFSSFKVM